MPFSLSETLVVGISSTALFDLSKPAKIWDELKEDDPDTAIDKYRQHMLEHEDEPLKPGTGFPLAKAFLSLNQYVEGDAPPITEIVVMSQNSPAELRAIKTLRKWDVYVDMAFFLGGVDKGPVVEAFHPHIFFDDQDAHIQSTRQSVPTGKVLYPTGSKLHQLQQERDEEISASQEAESPSDLDKDGAP